PFVVLAGRAGLLFDPIAFERDVAGRHVRALTLFGQPGRTLGELCLALPSRRQPLAQIDFALIEARELATESVDSLHCRREVHATCRELADESLVARLRLLARLAKPQRLALVPRLRLVRCRHALLEDGEDLTRSVPLPAELATCPL